MMIETFKLYIWIPEQITWTFNQIHGWMKDKFRVHFLADFSLHGDKIQYVATTASMLKLMLNLFCTSNIQGRELCLCDFIKYIFNTGLRLDTFESIFFNLGMMLDTTKLYSLISV